MLPPPYGNWGIPPEVLHALPSYSGDLATRQAEARRIMEVLGYGPSNRLKVKVSTRDLQFYRDRAVILVDQLNKIHFDAELEVYRNFGLVRAHGEQEVRGRAQRDWRRRG